MRRKAIALISGGLDSLLAAKAVMEQGIEVVGACFVMSFASRDLDSFKQKVREACADADIPVKMFDISEEFLEVLKRPEHGFGSNLNPCIDCKILMLRRAKGLMEQEGAGFVVTGEVVGERPMSQRREIMNRIRKMSMLGGFLLRPLSARLLEETIPEKEGVVDREALFDIRGRSRKPQFELAQKYGIKRFFSPAGGCLLTDPGFSRRLKDLMQAGKMGLDDINLLKYGRHFRLDDATKVIVGRNEKDNAGIIALKKEEDILLHLKEKAGPYVLLRGELSSSNIERAALLCVSHSKSKNCPSNEKILYWTDDNNKKDMLIGAMERAEAEKLRV